MIANNQQFVNSNSIKFFLSHFFRENEVIQFASGIDKDKTYNNIFSFSNSDSSLSHFIQYALKLQERHHGVFFRCNLMSGTKKESALRINALFADFDFKDSKDVELDKFNAWDLLNNCAFKPSLVNTTKNGLHCYWLVDGVPVAEFEQWQVRLHAWLKTMGLIADHKVKAVSNLLRVPEFNHLKDPNEPFQIKTVSNNNIRYGLSELEIALPKNNVLKTLGGEAPTIRLKGTIYNTNISLYNTTLYNSIYIDTKNNKDNMYYKFYDTKRDKLVFNYFDFISYVNSLDIRELFGVDSKINCPFHDDRKESAVFYTGKEGNTLFYCHSSNCSCNKAMTNFEFISKIKGKSFNETITWLLQEFNADLGADTIASEIEKCSINMNGIDYFKYPNIYYLFEKHLSALNKIHEYQGEKVCFEEMKSKGKVIGFMSSRFFASLIDTDKATANRLFNLMCNVGLLKKVFYWNVPEKIMARSIALMKTKYHKTITFFSIPEYTEEMLKQVDTECKRRLDYGIGVYNMGYDAIISNLGRDAVKRCYELKEEDITDAEIKPVCWETVMEIYEEIMFAPVSPRKLAMLKPNVQNRGGP